MSTEIYTRATSPLQDRYAISAGAHSSDPVSAVYLSRVLVALALMAQIIIAWRFWVLTWDDAAITLGFARTFALTGRIEPTSGSGVVEGYSTTLWMMLMAAVAKFVSAHALLAVAKIATMVLNITNILLARKWFSTWNTEVLSNLIAGSLGCGAMLYETINGMETPLMMALIFTMLLLFPSHSRLSRFCYILAGSAFVLVRWEAAWLLVPFVLIEQPRKHRLISAATWLSVFIASNLARFAYFGSFFPNTIIAKKGIPYSGGSALLELERHLKEPILILLPCIGMIAILAFVATQEGFDWRSKLNGKAFLGSSWQLQFVITYAIFSLILSTLIGKNWGPTAREFYSAYPFLFCLLLIPIVLHLKNRTLVIATALLCIVPATQFSITVQRLRSGIIPGGVTVDQVAQVNNVLTKIKRASHRKEILFAGPDMGGILLYSQGVKVIDLGLLCEPILARQRYAAVNRYVLQQRQPDIIEVHALWSGLTHFQDLPLFRKNYQPVYVDGERMFLRNNLLAEISPNLLARRDFTESEIQGKSVRGEEHKDPADVALDRVFTHYWILQ